MRKSFLDRFSARGLLKTKEAASRILKIRELPLDSNNIFVHRKEVKRCYLTNLKNASGPSMFSLLQSSRAALFSVVCVIAALSYVWGAATVQMHVWPYPILKVFGNHPSPEQAALGNSFRRSVFDAYNPDVCVVFLGDSITAQGPWQEMFPNIRVANRGIGGERFEHMYGRLDDVERLNPEVVFIMGGVNSAGKESVAKTLSDLRMTVDQLTEKGIQVVLQSTIEPRGERRQFVIEFNEALKGYASTEGLPLLDLALLQDTGGLREEWTLDGTHLNGTGYRQWETLLRPTIEEIVPKCAGAANQAN